MVKTTKPSKELSWSQKESKGIPLTDQDRTDKEVYRRSQLPPDQFKKGGKVKAKKKTKK